MLSVSDAPSLILQREQLSPSCGCLAKFGGVELDRVLDLAFGSARPDGRTPEDCATLKFDGGTVLASAAVGAARSSVIVVTSGATESNNSVIQGVAQAFAAPHLHQTAIEHASVLAPCRALEARGASVTVVDSDRAGVVHPEAIAKAMRPETRLISIMAANNRGRSRR